MFGWYSYFSTILNQDLGIWVELNLYVLTYVFKQNFWFIKFIFYGVIVLLIYNNEINYKFNKWFYFFKFIFKQFNFFSLFYVLLVSFFIFYINIIPNFSAECFLIKKDCSFLHNHVIGNHKIYTYKNVKYDIIYDIMYNIKHSNFPSINYKIVNFLNINGEKFLYNNPLSHPHLHFLEFTNIYPDILVNMQFSKQNYDNFHLLSDKILNFKPKNQYIANNFYFYEKKELIMNLSEFNNSNYLNVYNRDINIHINNVKNFYKI